MHKRGNVSLVLIAVVVVAAACSSSGSGSNDKAVGVGGDSATTVLAQPYEGYTSQVYEGTTNWLCKPGATNSPCDGNFDLTVINADGTTSVKPWTKAADPAIDCFYIYPTISQDPPPNSDLIPGDAERSVVQAQAARFGSQCRMFAPVYRQVPLTAISAALSGTPSSSTTSTAPSGPTPQQIAYADVLDAWKQYIANDNHGRGVVLLGHSQGTGDLIKLIKEEIDPNPALRSRLVSALLLGGSVAVPPGGDVGGDFQNIPLCRANDQTGCAITYASFRSTAPPPTDSFFGKPRSGDGVSGCTNPAALGGGSADTQPIFKNDRPWLKDPAAAQAITTQWVELPGLISTICASGNDRNYLAVTVHADPSSPRTDTIPGDLTPEWGLHVVDYSVAMGDLVDLVGQQAAAFAKGK